MTPQTIASCPVGSCTWTFDVTPARLDLGSPNDPTMTMSAYWVNSESAIRQHLETHTLLEWVQEVMRLREALDKATAEDDEAEWRARIEGALLDISSRLNEIPPARR